MEVIENIDGAAPEPRRYVRETAWFHAAGCECQGCLGSTLRRIEIVADKGGAPCR